MVRVPSVLCVQERVPEPVLWLRRSGELLGWGTAAESGSRGLQTGTLAACSNWRLFNLLRRVVVPNVRFGGNTSYLMVGMMKATLHLTFSRIRIVRKVDMYCNYLVCVVHAIQQACLSTPAEVRGPRKVLERHSARAKQRLGQGIHRNCCIVTLKCNWFKCVTWKVSVLVLAEI